MGKTPDLSVDMENLYINPALQGVCPASIEELSKLTTTQLMEGLPHHLHAARNDYAAKDERWKIWNAVHECYLNPGSPDLRSLLLMALSNINQKAFEAENEALHRRLSAKPKIVCLCGSTRFMAAFEAANHHETLAGHIVLSVGVNMKPGGMSASDPMNSMEVKRKLDELHLKKIEISDEILVLNVGGYVGESTAREVLFAKEIATHVRWLDLHQSLSIAELKAIGGLS